MKLGKHHHLKGVPRCIDCGKLVDGACGLDTDNLPDVGDFTVCIYCGSIMVFAEDLTLRRPTAAEMVEIVGDKRILAIQRVRGDLTNEQ
jgi:DNA-directed RNA polymerase subunit RPC12/RpoP